MKAIQSSLDLFEKQTDLEKGPRVAFMEVIAELKDPGENLKIVNQGLLKKNYTYDKINCYRHIFLSIAG